MRPIGSLFPLFVLWCLCGAGGLAIAQGTRGAPEAAVKPLELLSAPPAPAEWARYVERDATLAFPDRSVELARGALVSSETHAIRRAAALVTLGCANAIGERPILERLARTGTGLERCAAILALGEMGVGAESLFTDLFDLAPDPAADCAVLALLRSGRPAARRIVEELALERESPLGGAADALLLFAVDRGASVPTRAGAILLRLRWEAAKSFGLVRGEAWPVLMIAELVRREGFARDVVLRSSARIARPGVKDHVLGELQSGTATSRLRAAVGAMPRELSELIASGLWLPASGVEWTVLLDEIADQRAERLTTEILRAALERPELRYRALAMLGWSGDPDMGVLLDVDPSRLSVEERLDVCTAIGSQSDEGWLERFSALDTDKSDRVRMALAVASMRLGVKHARATVAGILADPALEEHAALVDVLCRTVRDPEVAVVLEDALQDAEGDLALRMALALALDGRNSGRSRVREALRDDPTLPSVRKTRLVRALRLNASSEDLEVFLALFPHETDVDLNQELVLGLVDLGDPLVEPVLRVSVWRGAFDESCLAAGLLAEHGGVRVLRHELKNPPTDASSNALRRLGFAIGEWGGLEEVEALSRELRYATGDPALQGALLGLLASRTQG